MSKTDHEQRVTSIKQTAEKKLRKILTDGEDSLMDQIEITEVPIFENEGIVDWIVWHQKLETQYATDVKPHILLITPIKKIPPKGLRIENILRLVKEHSVALTYAVGMNGPMTPLSFPAHSVIAVGNQDKQAGGSALDFICSSDLNTKTIDEDREPGEDAFLEAALAAVGFTALVLMRATSLEKG